MKMVYHQMRLAPHLARMVEDATTRYRQVCDTLMFIIRYIFGFYNYNVLCIFDFVC